MAFRSLRSLLAGAALSGGLLVLVASQSVPADGRAGLLAALAAAAPGAVIVLESGDYGDVTITSAFADTVTLRAATPLGPRFNSLRLDGAGHLRIEGVRIASSGNGTAASKVFSVEGDSHDIALAGSEVSGRADDDFSGHYGVFIGQASGVRIEGNSIHDVLNGITAFGSDHLQIIGNDIDRIGADVLKFAAVQDVLIENNISEGHVFPEKGAHLDFMQFQGSGSRNVTIRGNVYLGNTARNVQGIFVAGDGGHRDFLIEQNIIYTGMANGIVVYDGTGIVVRDNTVLNNLGRVHASSNILLPGGAVAHNNITGGPKGGLKGGNLRAQYADPDAPYHYNALYADAMHGIGLALEDLRPVPGSLAESMGAAARLAELLP